MIDETAVLNFYIEQMDGDKINFLIGRDKYKTIIKSCILEIKDQTDMNLKIQTAKTLWKTLFEAAMSYIDPNKEGYDSLFKYFDVYVNFEELIFASEAFYRDHTMHCLWVYFLGEYIRKQEQFKFLVEKMDDQRRITNNLKSVLKETNLENEFPGLISVASSLEKIDKLSEAAWCISAITHDLGYPLKKIYKINKCIKEILPFFAINDYSEFNFNYSDIQQNFINDFLKFLSTRVVPSSETIDEEETVIYKFCDIMPGTNNLQGLKKEVLRNINKGDLALLKKCFNIKLKLLTNYTAHFRYSNDFEQYQHGIMSAFLLMQIIKSFKKTSFAYYSHNDIDPNGVDFCDFTVKQMILCSISDHISEGYHLLAINDLSSFLAFVDELEEFSRISRANQNRQYVNEFCKTDIYVKDEILNIDFIFDNENIKNLNPEQAFKGRCKRFLSLFDLSRLEDKLKINLRCIGKLPYNKKTYLLELRKKYAKISIDAVEQAIPEYLCSSQFYTREEYMNM